MTYYFISDTHFGHENIIKYCNRPFKDVTEMDRTIIENYNKDISKDDIVFFLGDIGFNQKPIKEIIPQLKGTKILIRGNHDRLPTSP